MIRRAWALGAVLVLAACAQGHRPSMGLEEAEAVLQSGATDQRREAALSLGRWAQEGIPEADLRKALPALAAAAARDGEHVAGAAVWAWGRAARGARQSKLCEGPGDAAGAGVFKGALFRGSLARSAAAALQAYPECGMAAAKALLVVMEQARDPALKRQAAAALGVILAREAPEDVVAFAVPRLVLAQEAEDGELRLLAAQARVAMEIGLAPRTDMAEEDKIAEVLQLTREEDVALKAAAIRVFAQLEMAFSVDVLIEAAADETAAVRLAAVDGMARNGDGWEHVLPLLRRLAEEDESSLVRRRARKAAERLVPTVERVFFHNLR